jgi:polysaccharide export outer membrane protein
MKVLRDYARWIVAMGWPVGLAMAAAAAAQAPRGDAGAQVAPAPSGEDYQLGVADKVRVILFNEPTLSGEFVVGANGMLSFPLVGDIAASGLTSGQVARAIEARLRDGYVLKPSVSIDVLTFRPFYILGEVNKPGEYPYSSGLTVDAAVAMAQGYTYRADKKRAIILHKGEAQAQRPELTPDLRVVPGDTIRIGERHW